MAETAPPTGLKTSHGFQQLVTVFLVPDQDAVMRRLRCLSCMKTCYLLTIVDESFRFSFAFPYASVDAKTVIVDFNQHFASFGMPACIHSGRGTAFMSELLMMFLRQRGIACSRTYVHNARGNGQYERYNDILRTAVKLSIKSRKVDLGHMGM